MPVNTPREDYKGFLNIWGRLRDCFNGRDAVLSAGPKYCPDLPGLNHNQNQEYRKRGSFYNAVSRTVFGLIGAIYQKAPKFVMREQFKPWLKDVTLTNITMDMFSLAASNEVMLIGRYGVLVDMAMPTIQDPTMVARPYFVSYRAEDIVNWRTERQGGEERLILVVLKEEVEETRLDDLFTPRCITQYRACQLVGNVYIQQLWRKKVGTDGKELDEWVEFGGVIIPVRRGKALDFIPFVFFGVYHSTPDLAQPSLLDLADVNLALWRNSVDYEYGLHLVALPTPWVAGVKGDAGGPMPIGPGKVWELDVNGKAGMLEFTGQGLKAILEAMEEKKKIMATLGARMLEAQQKLNETATAVLVRHSSDYANLRTVAQSVEQGLTFLLQTMVWWMSGENKPKDVIDASVELNKEFMLMKIDPTMVQTALRAVQAERMSFKTFYSILETGGWAREGIDATTEQADINKDPKPTPAAAPSKLPVM